MILNLSSLKLAILSLNEALAFSVTDKSSFEVALHRDAVIQRFEYTFELSWKFLRRTIKDIDQTRINELLTKADLFRVAAEFVLITDASAWLTAYEARNLTSHVYDQEVAKRVYAVAQKFAGLADALLAELISRYEPSS